jgi:hypothetical protein
MHAFNRYVIPHLEVIVLNYLTRIVYFDFSTQHVPKRCVLPADFV